MRVRWTETASGHLIAIYNFIERQNPNAAIDTVDMLLNTARAPPER
jgi:plasmid stabilization system protein ParE